MIYYIKGNKINLFHPKFVANNKRRCKLIIGNKLYPLRATCKITNNKNKVLKIKLLISFANKLNLKNMFLGCKLLKHFYLVKNNIQEEISIQEEYKEEQNGIVNKMI